ncbi:MAG TPA: hypothetical protein VJB16_01775, partial [archaeon]|nr:hypothetical protein [archaeon]
KSGAFSRRDTSLEGYYGLFGTCQQAFESVFNCAVAIEGAWEFSEDSSFPGAAAMADYFRNLEQLTLVQSVQAMDPVTLEEIAYRPIWSLQVKSGDLDGEYRDTDIDGYADYLAMKNAEVVAVDVSGPEDKKDGVFDVIFIDKSPLIGDNCYFPATVVSYDKVDTGQSNWCAIEGGAWNSVIRVAPEVGTVAGTVIGGVGAIPGAAAGAIGGAKTGTWIGASVYTFGVVFGDTVGLIQTEWPG